MMALNDRCLGTSLTLRIKSMNMDRMNPQAKYLAYHTRVIYRLVNTTSPGVRNISRLTELFEEGHNNYQQFHRREVNPLELS